MSRESLSDRLFPFAAREVQIVAMLYLGAAVLSGTCAVVLGLFNA